MFCAQAVLLQPERDARDESSCRETCDEGVGVLLRTQEEMNPKPKRVAVITLPDAEASGWTRARSLRGMVAGTGRATSTQTGLEG